MCGNNFSNPILIIIFLIFGFSLEAQEGERIFNATCAACHKISNQRLVGPGLANIHKKRSKEWFVKFVKSSQTLIKSGDVEAVKVFKEYNQLIMPDHVISNTELNSLFEYIKEVSPSKDEVFDSKIRLKEVPFNPTQEDILKGQELFSGKQRFKNNGTSCNSCHNIIKDEFISGGALAADLTDVYERLGKVGIEAMISGLPFPQMKNSYQNNKITEEEALQLTAFLKDVSEQRYYQSQRHTLFRNTLLICGGIGAFIMMGIFPMLWYNRKKESVNKRIYDRQIKSRN
jgi:cytochrome c551/c552